MWEELCEKGQIPCTMSPLAYSITHISRHVCWDYNAHEHCNPENNCRGKERWCHPSLSDCDTRESINCGSELCGRSMRLPRCLDSVDNVRTQSIQKMSASALSTLTEFTVFSALSAFSACAALSALAALVMARASTTVHKNTSCALCERRLHCSPVEGD